MQLWLDFQLRCVYLFDGVEDFCSRGQSSIMDRKLRVLHYFFFFYDEIIEQEWKLVDVYVV